jgi:hypothetical protein
MLRRIVLWSGVLLGIVGVVLVFSTRLPAAWLIAASAAWLLVSGWELRRICLGYARCHRLRLSAGGEMWRLDADGNWRPARLLPGSVLLRRVGWIRWDDGRGRQYAELLRGRSRESDDWRRLQVIWRHIGAMS